MIPGKISHKRLSKSVFSGGLSPRGASGRGCLTLSRLSSRAVTAPPLASICSPQSWFDVFELLACRPNCTAPALHRQAYLGYIYNLTQHHSVCVWCDFVWTVRDKERLSKCFSAIWASCAQREESSQFMDLWERRPKAAFAKPSKAPSGCPGLCVTLLTKITFSPGPSIAVRSLLPSCPLYTLSPSPLPANTDTAAYPELL